MATYWVNAAEHKPREDGFYWIRLHSGPTEYLAVYHNETFWAARLLGQTVTQEIALNVSQWRPIEVESSYGLTEVEKQALRHLEDFWNLYLELPGYDADDMRVIRDAVHTIQSIMAVRVAKRVDPDFWR